MIHLAGPVVLAAVLAGAGVYGLLARRNAVLVLVGAELLLAACTLLLVTANALPSGGLGQLGRDAADAPPPDPLLPGQVMAVFVITIAAAEIGVALAVILLLFRQRSTVDLAAVRELGEASPSYTPRPRAPAAGQSHRSTRTSQASRTSQAGRTSQANRTSQAGPGGAGAS